MRRAWYAFQHIFGGKTPAGRPAKPHPAIDAMRAKPYNPKPGEKAWVSIDVANRSAWNEAAAPAKGVKVQLTAGASAYEATVSLAQDELVTLSTQVSAPESGEVTVKLFQPGAEPVVKAFSLNRPDLVVDRIYTEPESPKAGDDVRFFAVVRNIGKADAKEFAVRFHVDDIKDMWVSWGCIWGDMKIAPGESRPIGGGFLWKATPGKHKVCAIANPDGSHEARYDNNARWQEIDIK